MSNILKAISPRLGSCRRRSSARRRKGRQASTTECGCFEDMPTICAKTVRP